jgi:tetratricopeptide (TPR) repeat protein
VIPFERERARFFFKARLRTAGQNDLLEAISYYHQAQRRDPENVDVQLAIAEVLTEMRRYEQSNRLLFPLLSLNESPAECFFGIACNFLGLQEFSHAHDSLESYLALDPDGEFVADALDMLDVIEDEGMLYSMPGVQPPEEREALNACARGRQLLENGRMDEAVKLLAMAAKKQPEYALCAAIWRLRILQKGFKRAMETVDGVSRKRRTTAGPLQYAAVPACRKGREGVQRELEFLKKPIRRIRRIGTVWLSYIWKWTACRTRWPC